jgi:hypothetical protein
VSSSWTLAAATYRIPKGSNICASGFIGHMLRKDANCRLKCSEKEKNIQCTFKVKGEHKLELGILSQLGFTTSVDP